MNTKRSLKPPGDTMKKLYLHKTPGGGGNLSIKKGANGMRRILETLLEENPGKVLVQIGGEQTDTLPYFA